MSHNKNDTNMISGSLPESEFILLVYAHLGRSLDAKGAAVLRQYLQDPYYVTRFVEICKQDRLIYELYSAGLPLNITGPDSMDFVTWQKLAKYEECAPAVENPQEKQIDEPIQEIQRQSVQIKINRGSLITLLLSMAAMLLFVLAIRFIPSKSGIEVATLTDSIKAKWADTQIPMDKGLRLVTGNTGYLLREGIAQIEFDNQAKVTIESPAEFEIVTGDQVKLNYGRLYAVIPQSAIGFTVGTPSARIIDLGTEFGIDAIAHGDTSLHVMKGKTTLIAGEKSNKVSMEVMVDEAKKVSFLTQTVSDIPCDKHFFAREINSSNRLIWRGENLGLASILAGGDGFQKILSLIGINPANGKFTSSVVGENRASKTAYNLVPDSKFIDGVFVPDGGQGPILISSGGHTFDCPDTKGLFTHEIAAIRGNFNEQNTTIPPVIFKGKLYNDDSQSIVMLHSNIGVTFDLQAIRESLPGLELKSFKAWGGMTEALRDSADQPDVDFWILIDGQIKYQRKMLKIEDGTISFDIPLELRDRFLTLIVTDGLQTIDKRDYPYANDFLYLMEPEFCITFSNKETSDSSK